MANLIYPNRRQVLAGGAALASLGVPALAQAVKRIGVITLYPISDPAAQARRKITTDALRARGWEEGRNLMLIQHTGATRAEREAVAQQLVAEKVDLILADPEGAVLAAMQATKTIPIVGIVGQAVELGMAQTLARPGGNVTGVSYQSQEEYGRVLSLLRDIRPNLARVGIPVHRDVLSWKAWFDSYVAGAQRASITIVALPPVLSPADIGPMLEAAKVERIQALIMPLLPFLSAAVWQQITSWAIEQRVVTHGTLLSRGESVLAFGPDMNELLRLVGEQVDRVLRGANPATTPFFQPTRWETVINQRLARAVGWPAPPSVLIRATEVIN